ncbi:MAG: RIP metalloprotease RseP [Bacteroidetes bacterium]|nr:RIP metalloprotease RseP [Bacteroidota bacterium]
MQLLAIDWGLVGIKAAQLILSLSIIVILHEFGHYLPAKLFKCRVEKFFLFFDPWFALVKKKIGDTVYGIGWLPLGGYVKISGMIDESMDKEQLSLPAEPWEFRSKPAWQRLIIMIGGVTVNVLMAFVIYAMILFVWGERKTPIQNVKNGISITDSVMYELGFKDGDKFIAINNEPIVYYEDVMKKLITGETVEIERDGKTQTINLPVNLIGKLVEKKRKGMFLFLPRVPVVVGEVPDTSNAAKAGLKKYDRIIAVDSLHTGFYDEYKKLLDTKKGETIQLVVERNGSLDTLHTLVSKEGAIGFYRFLDPESLDSLGLVKQEKKSYGFFESFPAGVKLAVDNLKSYVEQFKKILSPKTEAYKGLGGFKSMGSAFPSVWDWQSFWAVTAFFCIALAFMNLLPIPALDGGHVLFTLIEMITGRKPSQKFLEYAQVAGMILLLSLVLYANGNDLFGWGKGK